MANDGNTQTTTRLDQGIYEDNHPLVTKIRQHYYQDSANAHAALISYDAMKQGGLQKSIEESADRSDTQTDITSKVAQEYIRQLRENLFSNIKVNDDNPDSDDASPEDLRWIKPVLEEMQNVGDEIAGALDLLFNIIISAVSIVIGIVFAFDERAVGAFIHPLSMPVLTIQPRAIVTLLTLIIGAVIFFIWKEKVNKYVLHPLHQSIRWLTIFQVEVEYNNNDPLCPASVERKHSINALKNAADVQDAINSMHQEQGSKKPDEQATDHEPLSTDQIDKQIGDAVNAVSAEDIVSSGLIPADAELITYKPKTREKYSIKLVAPAKPGGAITFRGSTQKTGEGDLVFPSLNKAYRRLVINRPVNATLQWKYQKGGEDHLWKTIQVAYCIKKGSFTLEQYDGYQNGHTFMPSADKVQAFIDTDTK